MQIIVLVAVGIAATALLASVANFRFLLYPIFPRLNPVANVKELELTGNTLFISDLHLRVGREFEFSKNIRIFVERRHVSNLVVVGDLFHSPEDAEEMFSHAANPGLLKVLGLDSLAVRVFWVQGSPVHDPAVMEDSGGRNGPVVWLGQCVRIRLGRSTILAYHGHDLSWKGAFGHAWDRFIGRLSLEKLWKRLAKVPASDWAVFGHTHIPGVDMKHRVANCGGWMTVPLLVRPSATGIYVSQENSFPEVVKLS